MLVTSLTDRIYAANLKSIATIFIITLGLSSVHCSSDAAANEMRKAIQRELPTGSSEEQVIRFLESRSISNSKRKLDGSEPLYSHGLRPEYKPGLERVIMGSITREFLGRKWSELLIVFYFDQDNRLKLYEVKNT